MKRVVFLLIAFGLFACNPQSNQVKVLQNRVDSLKHELQVCKNTEYLAQSLLWFQHSPEMQALYLQGYNVARQALTYNLKHKAFKNKKNAVVVDIDETILSNGLYDGWLYTSNNGYSDSNWNAWVQDVQAEPLPGAVDFLNFVKDSGCEVFYVTNRKQDPLFEPTLQNLKKFNLPFADEDHLLLKTKADTTQTGRTTKEKRRLKIANELNYEILLLCGDQVADFDEAFDVVGGGSEEQIKEQLQKAKENFGSKFIVLPNPTYSDWLDQIVKGNDRKTAPFDLRKSKILSWKH